MYLSSIGEKKEAGDAPLFIHISAHGNSEEIVVGPDHVPWKDRRHGVLSILQRHMRI